MSTWDDKGLARVREFREAFGIDQPSTPTIPDEPVHLALAIYHQEAKRLGEELKKASADAGGSVLLLRLQLIQEELAELAAGFISRDPVECLDALVDLTYVVDGTYLATGLAHHKEPGQAEVHRSNMSKLDADGKPIIGPSGRVEKSDQYSKPDLHKVLGQCVRCPEKSVTNLDGDELCQSHASEWSAGEGIAAQERERGDDNAPDA